MSAIKLFIAYTLYDKRRYEERTDHINPDTTGKLPAKTDGAYLPYA